MMREIERLRLSRRAGANDMKYPEEMYLNSGFMDGEPVSCYTCLKCIEDWLEESGQIEPEE